MENSLQHYGVLGMKWGVRRSPAQLGRKRKTSTNYHDDYRKAHAKDSYKTMSDKELRSRLNRLQMEQQYSKLNPSNIAKGKSYVNSFIKAATTVGSITGTALTIYNNSSRIKELIKK